MQMISELRAEGRQKPRRPGGQGGQSAKRRQGVKPAKPRQGQGLVKLRILFSYDGTHFAGWQRQKGKRTVQGALEEALSHLFQRPIFTVASGRTDRGVHALGQTAHFEVPSAALRGKNLLPALNHLTPEDISIQNGWRAPKDFHARFSAEGKTYLYFLSARPRRGAIMRNFIASFPGPLRLSMLNELAQAIEGRFDFQSFQNAGSEARSSVREIYRAYWREAEPQIFYLSITANGFLRRMARNIVSASIELARQGRGKEGMRQILEKKDRSAAPPPAPPEGLFLKEAIYPQSLEERCQPLSS